MSTQHHLVRAWIATLLMVSAGLQAQEDLVRDSDAWQAQAVEHARLLSQVRWTPVANTLPNRKGGFFEAGKENIGVPYSSVRSEGRYIGFDIGLRTFLAAVENPRSVLYTENLTGKVSNAAAYYGAVCSSYTSYALGCGIWEVSRRYGPQISDGIQLVQPQSADGARVGDVIYTPHATESSGSHVEMGDGGPERRFGASDLSAGRGKSASYHRDHGTQPRAIQRAPRFA